MTAVEIELGTHRFEPLGWPLGIAPRSDIVDRRAVGELLGGQLGREKHGVVVVREKQEQGPLARFLGEPGEVFEVPAREEDDSVGGRLGQSTSTGCQPIRVWRHGGTWSALWV